MTIDDFFISAPLKIFSATLQPQIQIAVCYTACGAFNYFMSRAIIKLRFSLRDGTTKTGK